MIQIQTLDDLKQQVAEVRKGCFITNFFLDPVKHAMWIAKGDCFTDRVGNTLFIIRCDKLFWNVFYSTSTPEQLSVDLKELKGKYPKQTMMFDIVGREAQCQPVVEIMKEIGCQEATSLVRMTRIAEPLDYTPDPTVIRATKQDIPQVSQLLHQYFNSQMEQIPYDEELCEYADLGHVLLCKEEGLLAGFIIYELSNTTLYFRYWFTYPDFRERKIGSRLWRRVFEDGRDTRRQMLWVIRSNENAIKRYRHYSFEEENMFDYVMQLN